MRILVIEDDKALGDQLKALLSDAGFACDLARDGTDGLHCAMEYPIDVAVVDLGLPGVDGVEIIRRVRESGLDYPILILTARDDWRDKVKGLEAGADDYLTKPFNIEEMLARVNALLRRSKGFTDSKIKLDGMVLDTAAKQLLVDGDPIITTAYEYRTIECLMLNAGKVLSKSQLSEHIYDEDAEHDSNVIEVFVGRLRKKLAPYDQDQRIETVRGQGYRLKEREP